MLAATCSAPGFGAGVDQDVAVAAGDEDRGDPARADEIGVAVDPHRRRGLVPIVRAGARRDPLRPGLLDRRARPLDLLRRAAEREDDLLRERGEERG